MNRESTIQNINVDLIIPNRFQPRLTFDENALNELAKSIKEHGIIQPLVLRRVDDKYEIIAGERRYKAAQLAGLSEVPAIITDIDDNKSAEVALVENVQRKNLNSMEEARSYKKILDKGYLTQEALAQKMGISQSNLANKLRLLNLAPEVQEALVNNKISERHARSLLLVNDPLRQISLLNRIIAERLTVRQLDAIIKENTTTTVVPSPVNITPSVEIPDVVKEETVTPTEAVENSPVQQEESAVVTNEEVSASDNDTEGAHTDVETLDTLDDDIEKHDNPLDRILEKITGPQYPSLEDEAANLNMDTDDYFNPFNNVDNEPMPQFDAPKEEEPAVIEEKEEEVPEVVEEKPQFVIEPNNFESIKKAYNNLRNEIEKAGYKITTEDFDFEDIYQIIIKIDKPEE